MNKFLDRYQISKLNQDQINHITCPIRPKEIDAVLKENLKEHQQSANRRLRRGVSEYEITLVQRCLEDDTTFHSLNQDTLSIGCEPNTVLCVTDAVINRKKNCWSFLFTGVVGGINLEEQGLKMWQNKVSQNTQLYLEHQTIYTLRVKKSNLSKMYSHKDEPPMADKCHMTKTCFLWRRINNENNQL